MRAWLGVVVFVGFTACGGVTAGEPDAGDCGGACDENATCTANVCECNGGFTGDGTTCEDVNECDTNNGGCDANAFCTNLPGTRVCTCLDEFTGDGETCEPLWQMVGEISGIDINPENFRAIATAAGDTIYFGPRANNPPSRFMRSFNTATGQFSGPLALPPGSQTDFCACGFTSIFESDGASLYLLGNEGFRYDPANDTWTNVADYLNNRRGESGGAFDSVSNALFMAGGRVTQTDTLRMDRATETFSIEPGTYPVNMDRAEAHVAGAGSPVYIIGSGILMSLVPSSGTYTTLAPPPPTFARNMGHDGNLLWMFDGSELSFYDPALDAWSTETIGTPGDTIVVVTAANKTYALVKEGVAVQVHELQGTSHLPF